MDRYTYAPVTTDDAAPGARAYLGNFRADPTGEWVNIPNCHGSDYSGDCVTVSNHRVWLKEYGGVDVYGDYGSYAVFVHEADVTDDMREALAQMEDYPVLDEDDLSAVETEAQDEAWDSWARADYKRALIARYPEREEELEESLSEDRLAELFDAARASDNLEWVNEEGNNAWIDLDRVAAATVLG